MTLIIRGVSRDLMNKVVNCYDNVYSVKWSDCELFDLYFPEVKTIKSTDNDNKYVDLRRIITFYNSIGSLVTFGIHRSEYNEMEVR